MKKNVRFFLLSALIMGLFATSTTLSAQTNPRTIVDKMVRAMDSYQTLSFELKRKERFKGKMNEGKLFAKVQESPRRIYAKNYYPDKDSEVLYIAGTNKGNAKINPAKFPWVNLDLDPHGDVMMKKQHHSIHELGYRFVSTIVKDALKKHGEEFDNYVSYKGTQTFDGKKCHVIVIDYPKWAYEPYTVKSGENLFTIARKMIVSEQLILEKNGLSDFKDVDAGDKIMIPNVFAKKSILLVDASTYLPLVQEVHDEKGMFERYEYLKLKVNPRFTGNDFSDDNDSYGF